LRQILQAAARKGRRFGVASGSDAQAERRGAAMLAIVSHGGQLLLGLSLRNVAALTFCRLEPHQSEHLKILGLRRLPEDLVGERG
jgi:hypothetical protein